jgi:hypothetical protein
MQASPRQISTNRLKILLWSGFLAMRALIGQIKFRR